MRFERRVRRVLSRLTYVNPTPPITPSIRVIGRKLRLACYRNKKKLKVLCEGPQSNEIL